jgi:hypothetical protein
MCSHQGYPDSELSVKKYNLGMSTKGQFKGELNESEYCAVDPATVAAAIAGGLGHTTETALAEGIDDAIGLFIRVFAKSLNITVR